MPTNLKYVPGTTRACKVCATEFTVSSNRQITGDFCSPRCGIWWGLSRSPKWIKRRDTTRPTVSAPDGAATSPKGGPVSPSAPDILGVPEASLSQPAFDRI